MTPWPRGAGLRACQPAFRPAFLALLTCALWAQAPASKPAARAEALWREGAYQEASNLFALAVKQQPRNADIRVRWGRLFLERFNRADAAQLFNEALEIQPKHAAALLGLALVYAEQFDTRAVSFAENALAADPKLVEAHVLLARLALEDGDTNLAAKHADDALGISPDALDAMGVHAAIDWLDDKGDSPWPARILKRDPHYGEAWAAAGRIFVLNRRYEEGIRLYTKAVELNPRLWPAHSELGINLMRLGHDAEARKHLELAYNNDYRDAATVNTLRLLDSYSRFDFIPAGPVVLKLNKKEAAALRPYFEAEARRALAVYEKKYGYHLPRPVRIEVYPEHEDFAVRTLGMPGLGALGVTFGGVVAMDSPSGRKRGDFHWASTLWHELSHVYLLTMTNHRVPRWFTEGVAVHEETAAASPEWGDRVSPEVLEAIRDKKLLPVAQLDRGFIRPSYPAQVVVSYFQAGRICDYIAKTWGDRKLVEMIHAFGARKSTPEAIRETLGITPEELDKRFLADLDGELRHSVDALGDWQKKTRELIAAQKAGRYDEVLRLAPVVRDLYPDYVEDHSAYEALAEAQEKSGDKAGAVATLTAYVKRGGKRPESIQRLAALLEESGRKREAAGALSRLLYIDPLDDSVHAKLGDLRLALGDAAGAIQEYSAVIALRPQDPAASRFNLARAYRAASRDDMAKEQLLMALEAAPGFKPAQRMLLELSRED